MMTRSKKWMVCLLFLSFSVLSCAQSAPSFFKNASVGIQGHYGLFLTIAPKAQYLRDSYTFFGEIFFQKQTDGSKPWQKANGLPQWGFGLSFGNTGSRKYMGTVTGVFPFIKFPLYKALQIKGSIRMGAGLGWIQKPYNIYTNHKNVLIGSHINAYVNFLWQNEFKISSHLFANIGAEFSHLSNGSSTLPNLGLNMPTVTAGLRYAFHKEVRAGQPPSSHSYNSKWSYTVYGSAGARQSPWVGSKRYLISTVHTEAGRQFSYSDIYGAGFIIYYDPTIAINNFGVSEKNGNLKNTQVGLYLFYERLLGRFSIPVQAGAIVYNQARAPLLFQALGFRYRVSSHWSAELLLKTHLGKADFIGAGLGYRIK